MNPIDYVSNDIYMAHPMSAGVTENHQKLFNLVKSSLREIGYLVIDPSEWEISTDPNLEDPNLAFQRNVVSIANSKLMVAVCTGPSIGLGGEFVLAAAMRKYIISYFPNKKFRPAWSVMHSDELVYTMTGLLSIIEDYLRR